MPGRGDALRPILIAAASTAVVFGGLAAVIVNSPGWPKVRAAFFDNDIFWRALPGIVGAILLARGERLSKRPWTEKVDGTRN